MARAQKRVQDTAGFDVPSPPAEPTSPVLAPKVEVKQQPEEELPDDLKAAIALLQETEALPERNAPEQRAKQAKLNRIRRHVFNLQQGLPAVAMEADSLVPQLANQSATIKAERLELLARQNRDVAELLEENAKLKEQLAKARK